MGVFGQANNNTITELGIIAVDIECTKTTITTENDVVDQVIDEENEDKILEEDD